MGMIFYDISFLVLFTLAVTVFLIIERKKLVRDGLMFLYKTSIGLKFMDNFAKKHPKLLKFTSYLVIFTGVILLIASIYFLIDILFMFTNPAFVKLVKIPPITPLIPYIDTIFKVSWLPPLYFTYWIIAIALVAIFHEGFHGIFARFYNVRIKSSGFGFLGPFLAFFVEQDDKQMKKAKPFGQMTILAAGVFANILLTIIFSVILAVFFSLAYSPSGVNFNDYSYSFAPVSSVVGAIVMNDSLNVGGLNFTKIKLENNSYYVSSEFFRLNLSEVSSDTPTKLYNDFPAINAGMKSPIIKINGKIITSLTDIRKEIDNYKPGQTITVSTKNKNQTGPYITTYDIQLASDPNNSSRAILGIATVQQKQTIFKSLMSKVMGASKDPNIYYEAKTNADLTEFFYNLLLWLVMINFGVALANMWPVAIFDGGYFFYLIVLSITKNKKIAEKSLKISTTLFLGAIALLMIFWAVGMFWKF